MHPFAVDVPSFIPQQNRDPAVTIARVARASSRIRLLSSAWPLRCCMVYLCVDRG